jgi:glycerol-3-phosphate O-acyltransferase
VVKSTNLVSRTVFDWLKERGAGMDLYRLLRTGGPDESLPIIQAYEGVERRLDNLRKLQSEHRIIIDESVAKADPMTVVQNALKHLGSYHRRPALVRRGDRLFHEDRNLVYYYQNRLNGFDLGAAT